MFLGHPVYEKLENDKINISPSIVEEVFFNSFVDLILMFQKYKFYCSKNIDFNSSHFSMFLTLNLKQTKILKISCQKSLFPFF